MKIELKEIAIRDLVEGYEDKGEEGVYGYSGNLNIRPAYQREFVYKDKQRDEVINTITKDFPLNIIYWVKNEDDTYEVLDGQQRTISIASYVQGAFSLNYQYFHNLTEEDKNQILDYKLMVYFCEGGDNEKLDWFQTINIAGEKLTDQELRNAIYTGKWLKEAKRHFSKSGCPAYQIGSDYLSGSPIRQDYLETVLKWINDGDIKDYMSKHQHDNDCNELWTYFQKVINWVKITFPDYKKEMKGIDWGHLYDKYKDENYNSKMLENEIKELMLDDEVTKKKGIYPYLLSHKKEAKHLNIRQFTPKISREAFERQNGVCPSCKETFEIDKMEADHITPWHEGGKTKSENCQMLCKECNRRKGGK
jgi:hypothetical protein